MKIIALQAENIKKLVAVDIRPDGNIVQITGKNGQGKTSVLDCIWWGLEGAKHIQKEPIRKGSKSAHIIIDLGELIVTRTFDKKDDGEITTRLTITNAEGTTLKKPQDILDGLLGALTFDPLEFTRKNPKEQFNILKQFVPGVDFDAIDAANKVDYDNRTDVNRRAKELKAQASAIADIPEGAQPIDEKALVEELEAAGKTNADLQVRANNRKNLAKDSNDLQERAAIISKEIAELDQKIKNLIEERREALQKSKDIDAKLSSAPPLAAPVSTELIKAKIESAKLINASISEYGKKANLIEAAEALEAESLALSSDMDDRNNKKLLAIQNAKLPVKGITFGDGILLFNGIPFEQCSYSEQLRASISIAMAWNPKIKIIRCDEGSSLDEDSLKIIEEMAKDKDYQIWISRVDSSGKVGVVIEEGYIKGEQAGADF